MDKLEQQQYWARQMSAAPPVADPVADPEPALPATARTRSQFGEVHPDPASLKAMGQQFAPEPLVDVAPAPLLDTSMVAGTHTPRPRENISPFRTDTMER